MYKYYSSNGKGNVLLLLAGLVNLQKKKRSPGPSTSSKHAVNNISDACARRVPMYDTLILRTNVEALLLLH